MLNGYRSARRSRDPNIYLNIYMNKTVAMAFEKKLLEPEHSWIDLFAIVFHFEGSLIAESATYHVHGEKMRDVSKAFLQKRDL